MKDAGARDCDVFCQGPQIPMITQHCVFKGIILFIKLGGKLYLSAEIMDVLHQYDRFCQM